MRPGGGASKGYAYEREVCKLLSLWVSDGTREDLFWRTATSGGRATVARRKGKDHRTHEGDIAATDPLGNVLTDAWYLECKRYADLEYARFMLKGEGKLADFWQTAVAEATTVGKLPMLIAREDRGRTTLLVAQAIQMDRPMGMATDVNLLDTSTRICTVHKHNVEIHDFEAVVARPFVRIALPPGARWLRPGEDPFSIAKIATPRVRPRIKSKYNKRRGT